MNTGLTNDNRENTIKAKLHQFDIWEVECRGTQLYMEFESNATSISYFTATFPNSHPERELRLHPRSACSRLNLQGSYTVIIIIGYFVFVCFSVCGFVSKDSQMTFYIGMGGSNFTLGRFSSFWARAWF